MSFFNIFSPDTANKAVDAIINTADSLVYTDEEKAKSQQLLIETKLKMLPLYEPFKIAQRYLAFGFSINFLVAFWIAVSMALYSTPERFNLFMNIVMSFSIQWIMLAIITFYFGGGFVNSFSNQKKDLK